MLKNRRFWGRVFCRIAEMSCIWIFLIWTGRLQVWKYKADSNISTIGTDGEKIYFNPKFLMEKYVEDPAALRRGYLHILLHCLYLHVFLIPQGLEAAEAVKRNEWDRECDRFVENLIEKAVRDEKDTKSG